MAQAFEDGIAKAKRVGEAQSAIIQATLEKLPRQANRVVLVGPRTPAGEKGPPKKRGPKPDPSVGLHKLVGFSKTHVKWEHCGKKCRKDRKPGQWRAVPCAVRRKRDPGETRGHLLVGEHRMKCVLCLSKCTRNTRWRLLRYPCAVQGLNVSRAIRHKWKVCGIEAVCIRCKRRCNLGTVAAVAGTGCVRLRPRRRMG